MKTDSMLMRKVDTTPKEKPLAKMTKEELVDLVAAEELDVDTKLAKAKLVEAIEEARKLKAEEAEGDTETE